MTSQEREDLVAYEDGHKPKKPRPGGASDHPSRNRNRDTED